MVVDSSVICAIVFGEAERDEYIGILLDCSSPPKMSVVSYVETAIAVFRRQRIARAELDRLLDELRIRLVAVDTFQAIEAVEAFYRYGKNQHEANLNFGDCFSYALAKALDDSLFYKGKDFAATDLARS